MNIKEAMDILNWLSAHFFELDESDKMMVMAYYIKLGEGLKPFYDKYHTDADC